MKKFSNLLTLLFAFVVVAALAACTSTTEDAGTTTEKPAESTTVESVTSDDNNSTDHVHVFDQQVPTKAYQVSAATCTEAAVYYYTCECGEIGTETFTYGEALGHSWDEGTVTLAATCTEAGKKTYTCTRCNETKEEVIDALGHTFEDAPAGWTTASGVVIKYHCSVCNKYFDADKNELEFSVPEAQYTESLKVENGKLVYAKTPTQECAPYYEEVKYTSTEEVTELTVAQAADNYLKVEGGKYSGLVMVTGKVAAVVNSTYGNSYLYVENEDGSITSFYVYGACTFAPGTENNFKLTLNEDGTLKAERGSSAKTFTTEGKALYKAGDTVTLVGWIQNYVKDEVSTIELVKSIALNVTEGELTGAAHVTVNADENVASVKFTVDGAEKTAAELQVGDKATVTVTFKDGFVLDSMSASAFGTKVTIAEDNSFDVTFNTELTVKSIEDGVVKPIPTVVTAPTADGVYRLGTYQGGLTKPDYIFINGKIANGYYGATTTDFDSALAVKLEATEGGFYLTTTIDGAKKYISVVVSGTHYNFSYVDKDALVFSYDATNKMLVANAGTAETQDLVFMGSSGTYTTVGGYQIAKLGEGTYYGLNLYEWENRPELEKVELGETSLEVEEGDSAQIQFKYTPVNAAKLTWTFKSNDETVATVDANGVITAVKAGETTVTATNGDLVLTLNVKVTAVVANPAPEYCVAGYDLSNYATDSSATITADNAASIVANLANFQVYDNCPHIISSFVDFDKFYTGQSKHFDKGFKFGTGSANGKVTIKLNTKVTKIVVSVYGWTATDTLTISSGTEKLDTVTPGVAYDQEGALKTYTFTFANEVEEVSILFEKRGYIKTIDFYNEKSSAPETPTLTGVKVAGGATADLTLNTETKLYEGTFKLARQWAQVGFDLVYSDNTTTRLTYANATFSGDGICSARVANATGTAQLFADSDELENAGNFCYSLTTETNYKVTVNSETKAVTVNILAPAGLSYNGAASGSFTLNESGSYTAVISIPKWKALSFVFSDGNGNNTTLWYDNTTFTGKVTAADNEGDQWDGSLYHEGNSFFVGADTTFEFTYNPTTKTMNVAPYFDFATFASLTATTNEETSFTFTKGEDNKFSAIITLNNEWASLVFTAKDGSGNALVLWYNNSTFTGEAVKSAAQGATWSTVLYSEADNTKGEFFLSTNGPAVYEASYDPATKTMTITFHQS